MYDATRRLSEPPRAIPTGCHRQDCPRAEPRVASGLPSASLREKSADASLSGGPERTEFVPSQRPHPVMTQTFGFRPGFGRLVAQPADQAAIECNPRISLPILQEV